MNHQDRLCRWKKWWNILQSSVVWMYLLLGPWDRLVSSNLNKLVLALAPSLLVLFAVWSPEIGSCEVLSRKQPVLLMVMIYESFQYGHDPFQTPCIVTARYLTSLIILFQYLGSSAVPILQFRQPQRADSSEAEPQDYFIRIGCVEESTNSIQFQRLENSISFFHTFPYFSIWFGDLIFI